MNAYLRAALDAGLATVERVVDAPTVPLGYGTDVAWRLDLVEPMRDVDPTSTEAIADAIIRRLDCPRGRLVDDADYGLDVVGFLNRGTTPAEVNGLAGAIRNELEKDDRILTATVSAVPTRSGLAISIAVVPASPETGQFALTFAATSAGLVLKEITQ